MGESDNLTGFVIQSHYQAESDKCTRFCIITRRVLLEKEAASRRPPPIKGLILRIIEQEWLLSTGRPRRVTRRS